MTLQPLRCVLLGAGGHAQGLIEALCATHEGIELVAVDRSRGGRILNVQIVGDDSALADLARAGVDHFVVAVGSVGRSDIRGRLFELGLAHGMKPLVVQHPAALVAPSAQLGAGCQIMAGAIVGSGSHVGANAIINTGAIIEHDCRIADHAHIASGAVLSGAVSIGRGAHIGAGAVLIQSITVGHGAVVGAGAAVIRDVLPGDLVVGVPAVVKRRSAS